MKRFRMMMFKALFPAEVAEQKELQKRVRNSESEVEALKTTNAYLQKMFEASALHYEECRKNCPWKSISNGFQESQ